MKSGHLQLAAAAVSGLNASILLTFAALVASFVEIIVVIVVIVLVLFKVVVRVHIVILDADV